MSHEVLQRFGITDRPAAVATGATWRAGPRAPVIARSPIDGSALATIPSASAADVGTVIEAAQAAFLKFRVIPAPIRGEFVRRIGMKLRERKRDLADLVTLEAGKITSESLGEVQEMIDICDFAVGLSRQLHGLTIASERPGHRMMEQYHPLGVVGVISAFNFPVAVWAWNAMLALVCGDPVIWKPSEKTPLTALATHQVVIDTLDGSTDLNIPDAVVNLVIGGPDVGEALVSSPQVPLISATGSTRMGRAVGQVVAGRFGRTILELGGNNAMIVAPSADQEMAIRAITFAAFGTAGQRCTTLRRLIVHEDLYDKIVPRVQAIAAKLSVGDPRTPGTLVGPLIDRAAFDAMQATLDQARAAGGTVLGGTRVERQQRLRLLRQAGDRRRSAPLGRDRPARDLRADPVLPSAIKRIDEAIAIQNDVPAGPQQRDLYDRDVREAELFLSPGGQ